MSCAKLICFQLLVECIFLFFSSQIVNLPLIPSDKYVHSFLLLYFPYHFKEIGEQASSFGVHFIHTLREANEIADSLNIHGIDSYSYNLYVGVRL